MRNRTKIVIGRIRNSKGNIKKNSLSLLVFLILLSIVYIAFAQPQIPLNIDGRVTSNASNGVPQGTIVWINNTANGRTTTVTTDDPGPPELKGIYSAAIIGSTGDVIVVKSWNATHYGENRSAAVSGTTTLGIKLNESRPSETNVTIILPSNNSRKNTSVAFNLTANVSVSGADGSNCNATISFSNGKANITQDQNYTNLLGNIQSSSSKRTTWNLSGIQHGNVNITVQSTCGSDGINLQGLNSYKIYLSINDTSSPFVKLVYPYNKSWVLQNITFIYNITENTGIKNCSLYIDDKINQSSFNITANEIKNFTVNNTPDGQHTWLISCYDNSTNFNQGNSSFFVFQSDGTPPNVTLLLPVNRSTISNSTIRFSYNATDNINVSNCSLIINDAIISTNRSVEEGTLSNFTVTTTGGDYNWSVNCSDNSYNVGYSGYFELISPDYFINLTYLVFNSESFVERQVVEINATVFNIGIANSTNNITIQFYENGLGQGGIHLRNYSANITTGKSQNFSINYTTSIGTYTIFALIDAPLSQNGTAIEKNESNNHANRTIFVSSYQIYYGDILSNIVLDTSLNLSVFAWMNLSNFRGTILAADSDSILNFNTLLSLTRNDTNNLSLDDLEDLDLKLNLTNKSDSLNRTYIADDELKNTYNFTFLSQRINFTPIVNSTNTSSFVTGILWDYSDSHDGEFDGNQDVAFITKVTRNSLGSYGAYDYEIKIPSNLKRYISPNIDDTITFYREIT